MSPLIGYSENDSRGTVVLHDPDRPGESITIHPYSIDGGGSEAESTSAEDFDGTILLAGGLKYGEMTCSIRAGRQPGVLYTRLLPWAGLAQADITKPIQKPGGSAVEVDRRRGLLTKVDPPKGEAGSSNAMDITLTFQVGAPL